MTDNSSNGIILEAANVKKYFGEEYVLQGIELQAQKGEIISIIGRSGCGKTTFLRCINCLNIMSEGEIRIGEITLKSEEFNNEKVHDDAKKSSKDNYLKDSLQFITNDEIRSKVLKIRQNVGFLFQNLNLFPHLSVIENVILPLEKVLGYSYDRARAESEYLLDKVDMKMMAERNSSKISGGQAQRVAIARALAVNPDIMLYDEPTSALDPELVLDFIEIVRQLKKEGMTQIIVTHSLGLARNVSETIAYMDKGIIVEKGSPDDLFQNPKDERTKDYISKLLLN
ncbi:MAG: amino acid ABC transporter ATP-binding protein [Candidatus Kapabacteria bacterium]|nr:amino acid ABC transporter ATP-binding protein [Ignavibacteriota bacterium]MCW5885335.1 amino acid ABC transporter ATP-binding protein [Candidatus Kapabacteria bacterium]